MKTIYQFLIILCSISLFSSEEFNDCHKETDSVTIEEGVCVGRSSDSGKCCYYKGSWKKDGSGSKCNEFVESEVYGHVKEVKKKLLAGTYWSKTTDDDEIMSRLDKFCCTTEECNSSSYVKIGLLVFISLLFLLF